MTNRLSLNTFAYLTGMGICMYYYRKIKYIALTYWERGLNHMVTPWVQPVMNCQIQILSWKFKNLICWSVMEITHMYKLGWSYLHFFLWYRHCLGWQSEFTATSQTWENQNFCSTELYYYTTDLKKTIQYITRCRDSRSAKSQETR